MKKCKNQKLRNLENLKNYSELFRVIPNLRLCVVAKIENSSLKNLKKISKISEISKISKISAWPFKFHKKGFLRYSRQI